MNHMPTFCSLCRQPVAIVTRLFLSVIDPDAEDEDHTELRSTQTDALKFAENVEVSCGHLPPPCMLPADADIVGEVSSRSSVAHN